MFGAQNLHVLHHALKDLLPRRFQGTPGLFDISHRNVFIALLQASESFLGELIERNSDRVSIFDVGLILFVVQFGYWVLVTCRQVAAEKTAYSAPQEGRSRRS